MAINYTQESQTRLVRHAEAAPGNPQVGDEYFNSTTQAYYVCTVAGTWRTRLAAAAPVPSAGEVPMGQAAADVAFVPLITAQTPVNAVAASGTLTTDETGPADGENVIIGSVTYVFKTALTTPAVPNEVLIGISAAVALDNLKSAINATAGAGTVYGTGTVIHPVVSATTNTDTTQLVVAKTAGVNAAVTTTTAVHLSWGAGTLAGGVDGTVGYIKQLMIDSSYLYVAIAANTIADANWRKVTLSAL